MNGKRKSIFKNADLTEGPIAKGIITFAVPLFLGQLLQQLYNVADAWVVGNFADNNAFAAVSSSGNLIFLITGFCNGLAIGGGVIISRYFGAKNREKTEMAVHNNVLMGLVASVFATVAGLLLVPLILKLMNVPDSVMPDSLTYFRIYFAGVSTVIMYNIFMSVMRSLGDSIHPLYYLALSSVVNVALDLLFVAVFKWGVGGAAGATVFSQGLSALLCLIRMMRADDASHISLKKLRFNGPMMKAVLAQGLPTGIQNSVISIGNVVIQANINSFGAYAMSGQGAYAKIEGFVFLPIMCISMSMPTFVSQNLGARQIDRAKKGSLFGIISGMVVAEIIGIFFHFCGRPLLSIFLSDPEAFTYGLRHAAICPLFYFVLAYSHCAAGVLRGCGKSVVPMIGMLACWCVFRIIYVTAALHFIPNYDVICWAYPITWSLTTIIFTIFILRMDWNNVFSVKKK